MGGILLSPEMFKAYFIVPKANPQYFLMALVSLTATASLSLTLNLLLSDQTVRLIFSKPFYF